MKCQFLQESKFSFGPGNTFKTDQKMIEGGRYVFFFFFFLPLWLNFYAMCS